MAKKKPPAKKNACEVGSFIGCNGCGVRVLTGPRKGDPVFRCCMGCEAYLRRGGIRLREVSEEPIKGEKRGKNGNVRRR